MEEDVALDFGHIGGEGKCIMGEFTVFAEVAFF